MANNQTFTLNIKAVADMKDVVSNIQGIQNALGKLKLPDGLKNSFKTNFKDLEKELDKYQRLMSGDIKTKGDANALTKSGNNILRLYDDIVKKINSIDDSTLRKAFSDLGAKEVENLRNQLTGLESDLKSKLNNQKFINFDNAKAQLKQFKTELNNLSGDAASAFKTLSNSTFNTFLKNLDTGRLDLAAQNLAKIKQQADQIGNINLSAWVNDLTNKFQQLQNDNSIRNTTQQIIQLKQQLASSEANIITNLITQFRNGTISAENFQSELNQIINTTNQWGQAQAQANKELDQVKSRIQYFFGLNNVINLVRRAVRGAYETIRELDKAMTETAVVTDFTVGDMWKQLPEYTKRANELGVTTKAAYEAATLYYQQGLTTEEVNALSVETLKMARIAGLDAAEATDRMTNALRGFNMELNSMNAQRVDDVYSKLAAISASNVDEISTAMTKVASLAHNAGMEFETTAAFLAQIIETTRESAETAGTALKTVVARFAEVKKLVGENELKGQDEEGELIDVNKVSAALRTAGIDLNKYFLGEVGIDDIFMELAQKWDSLTSLQQRYIATQAAGSRQQSRFIALMSDYARTQELVGAAYNANGAAAEQFVKTQESLESKLARLKNAWDQFTMGLTNNSVVKSAVDILTNLLNIINKITGAFGDGVGTILKWTTAILALRGIGAFVSNGGGLEQIIGSLTGKKGIRGFGKGIGLGTVAGKLWDSSKLLSVGTQLKGGLLGKVVGAADAGIMSMGGSASLAMGLSGLIPILGGVAAAVGAVTLGYQAWLKLTPEGHLRTATKLAEKLKETAKESKEVSDGYKDVQEKYKQYNDEIENTSSTTEKNAAVQAQNDYILSLLEQDSKYAKYLDSKTTNGQIQLSLNLEALNKDAQDAAEKAVKDQISSYFGNANQQKAKVEESKSKARNYINYAEDSRLYGDTAGENYWRAKAAEEQVAEANARTNMQAQSRLAYQNFFANSSLRDELKNSLSSALASVYDTTGEISDTTLTNLGSWIHSPDAQKIASLLSGDFKYGNLTGIEDDNLLASLEYNEDQFNSLTKALGLSKKQIEQFTKTIKDNAKANKDVQNRNKAELQTKANDLGIGNIDGFINNAAPDIWQLVLSALNSAADLDTSTQKSLAELLFDPEITEENIIEIQSFINGINFDKPVAAYQKLKEVIEQGGPLQGLAEQILKSNSKIFSQSNLLQTALSDVYDSLGEDIEKIIKKEGELTPENIEALSEESATLKSLIDADVVSVETLAKALTLISNGKIEFDQLSQAVINVLENTYGLNDVIHDVQKTISDFDEGTDYGEGIDFLVSKGEELAELINNQEFGNQRTKNLYELFFGDGSYTRDLALGVDYIEKSVNLITGLLDNDAYNFFSNESVMEKLGITDLGNGLLDWDISGVTNYHELISNVQESLSELGYNLSEDAARILLESFISHSHDSATINKWNELTMQSILESVGQTIKEGTTFTSQDLEAIAKQADVSVETLIAALSDRYGDDFKVLTGPYKRGNLSSEDFYNYFKQQIGIGKDDSPDQIRERLQKELLGSVGEDGTFTLDLPEVRLRLSNMGIEDENDQDLVIKKLFEQSGADEAYNAELTAGIKISDLTGVTIDKGIDIAQQIQDKIQSEYGGTSEVKIEHINAALDLANGVEGINSETIIPLVSALATLLSGADGLDVPVLIGQVNAYLPTDPEGLLSKEVYDKMLEVVAKYNENQPEDAKKLVVTPKGIIEIDPSLIGDLEVSAFQDLMNAYMSGTNLEYKDGQALIDGKVVLKGVTEEEVNTFNDNINKQDFTLYIKNIVATPEGIASLQASLNEANIPLYLHKPNSNFQRDYEINRQQMGEEGFGAFSNYPYLFSQAMSTLFDQQHNLYYAQSNYDALSKDEQEAFTQMASWFKAISSYPEAYEQFKTTWDNEFAGIADITSQEIEKIFSAVLQAVGKPVNGGYYTIDQDGGLVVDTSTSQENLETATEKAEEFGTITADLNGETITINVPIEQIEAAKAALTRLGYAIRNTSGTVNIRTQSDGGGLSPKMATQASGGYITSPEDSLLGEEGAEVVWNKEQGYSYIAGQNGPEFGHLNPGDRVFDANETRKILNNSNGLVFGSHAAGGWNLNKDSDKGGSGGGSGSGDGSNEKETEWKNEIDWLYNLVEDIAELEREQTKLQELYEDYLKDESKHGKDLYDLLVKQLGNLYTQLNHQQAALELREREMREFMDTTNEYDEYLWYNWEDRTLEVDWDAIEALQDKDTYDKIKELVSEAESIQKKMDDAEDAITDVQNQIQDLENIWRDTYVQFEERVYKAIVSYYQQIIDNYSELNTTLSESNTNILNAIQKQINLERQIRDNTQTEEDIADNEAQLAFLRRDTTGGNQLASLQLQKELDDQRQSYEDTLIDQAISRLQDDNSLAAEQREKQIEIMQAQLDYQEQNGEFNARVRELIESAMGADGELLTNSDLRNLLKTQEGFEGMSEVSKAVWEEELNSTFKEASAFVLEQYAKENGTFISALTGAIEGMTSVIGSKSQPKIKIDYGGSSSGGGSGGGDGGGGSGGGTTNTKSSSGTKEKFYLPTSANSGIFNAGTQSNIGSYNPITGAWERIKRYATGGLSSSAGLAWLDGTPSEPEYVLNARQTDAFLRLSEVLPAMMQGGVNTSNTFGGVNLNLVMNVDQIASDYDVDRIADRVKDIVYNAGQYRNVNTLNFIR